MRRFHQVDVFTDAPFFGNPLAVVVDSDGITTEQMHRFAHWTNLSETTFLLPPTHPDADYRVRIFTPSRELPFAGHPTLGSCHVWRSTGGEPRDPDNIVQECAAGLVRIRASGDRLAFAAPPLIKGGAVDPEHLRRATRILGLRPEQVLDATWAVNGPRWLALLVDSVDTLRRIEATPVDDRPFDLGACALIDHQGLSLEVRALFRERGPVIEDPVTGSLNAGLAMWLLSSGRLRAPYTAIQGLQLGRAGRVYVDQDATDTWIGGHVVTCVEGSVLM